MKAFQLRVVEPATGDVFGPEVAIAMRLPFSHGWDHYAIYQGDTEIMKIEDYEIARRTCSALNLATLKFGELAHVRTHV